MSPLLTKGPTPYQDAEYCPPYSSTDQTVCPLEALELGF